MHELRKIFGSDVLCHISALELSVNSMLGVVALGVRSNPSVVLNRGMQRLGTICHIVPKPAGVKDYRVFYGADWLMDFPKMPVFPESCLEPSEDFHRDVRLKSYVLRKVIVGMIGSGGRCALLVKFAIKLVPALRERVEPRNALEINVVVGFLGILESVFRWTSPSVGLGAKVGELCNRVPKEARHFSGDFLSRNPIDVFVSFVAPSENIDALEPEQCDQRAANQLAPECRWFPSQSDSN
jgi:hypothetical protein